METETQAAEPTTALAILEQTPPALLFAPGALNPILERVKAEARAAAADSDISTEPGRKAVASLAYKVARTKTFIDEKRIALVAGRKKEIEAIDAEGRNFRKEMDALKEEVRGPLTEWEEAEEARIAENQRRVDVITGIASSPYASIEGVEAASLELDELTDFTFSPEFRDKVSKVREKAALHLQAEADRLKKVATEKAERERKQADEAEQARIEREARIAEDARLKAEAEAKRREEAQAREAKQREEEHARLAAAEKTRLEREKAQAEERARKAEAERIAAEQKAEADRKQAIADKDAAERKAEADRIAALRKAEDARVAAEKKAEVDRIAAVEAERKRQDDARIAEENERFKREQDKAHRAKVNREALASLVKCGIEEVAAKAFVELVAKKLVTHITIQY
jgi:colicin import membrane protein